MVMVFSSGLPETTCGWGSTLAATGAVRAWLPPLLRRLGVQTFLDAPCGDLNWLTETDLSGIDVIGIDIDPERLALAKVNAAITGFRARSVSLIPGDLVRHKWPYADAVLCRDLHQHLPKNMIWRTLRSFVKSGTPWLIATTHYNQVNDPLDSPGRFRPLNLEAPPFNIIAREKINDPDGPTRSLGLWDRETVALSFQQLEHWCPRLESNQRIPN
jgi:SAM-dependent methyltransferase